MEVHERTNGGIDVKTDVLVLIAEKFEEERILAAIKNCIRKGGSMEICIPEGDDERVLKVSFEVTH